MEKWAFSDQIANERVDLLLESSEHARKCWACPPGSVELMKRYLNFPKVISELFSKAPVCDIDNLKKEAFRRFGGSDKIRWLLICDEIELNFDEITKALQEDDRSESTVRVIADTLFFLGYSQK
jgi:hypothetical protein